MAPTIPSVEPSTFRAGETVSWTKAVSDYPNTDGYSLVYTFSGPSTLEKVTATNETDGSYSVTLSAAITSELTAGRFRWAAHAESGSGASLARYPVASGIFIVAAKLLGDVVQTHAEKTLAVIEAALEGRLTADIESYTIGTRQVSKIPILELTKLRSIYAYQVAREHGISRTVKVAFVPA